MKTKIASALFGIAQLAITITPAHADVFSSFSTWFATRNAASQAALIAAPVAIGGLATIINLRNKQRADSAQLQDRTRPQARDDDRVYPAVIIGGKTFLCLQPDPAGGCALLQRAP